MEIVDLTPKDKSTIKINDTLPELPFNMTVIGKSGSGKTNLILNFISYYKKYFKDRVFIFTNSIDESFKSLETSIGAQIFNSLLNENGNNIIEIILKHQHKMLNQYSRKKLKHIVLLFDDFILDRDIQKRVSIFTKLFSQARHYNISVIITSQQFTLIPANLRRMVMYSISFGISNSKELDIMSFEYCNGINKDIYEFKTIFKDATKERYSFLYLDMKKNKYYKNFGKE